MTPQPTHHRRASLLAGLATAALLSATAVRAQTAHEVHIPAGALNAALLALADQSHDQLLYQPGLVTGLKARALDGAFSTEEALMLRHLEPTLFSFDVRPARLQPNGVEFPAYPMNKPVVTQAFSLCLDVGAAGEWADYDVDLLREFDLEAIQCEWAYGHRRSLRLRFLHTQNPI